MLFKRKQEKIDAVEAAARIERGEAVALDVREAQEWAAGRIPRATHIPMGELGSRLGEVPRDKQVITVCRSGARSERVAAALQERGFQVLNLEGGMKAWAKADLPLEPPSGRVA